MLHLCRVSGSKRYTFLHFYRILFMRTDSLLLQVIYFFSLSSLGFLILRSLDPRTHGSLSSNPRTLDLFFTSISAATVSSMSTVEMEVFSNLQLIVLTILMFLGGEVFTSMVGLYLMRVRLRLRMLLRTEDNVEPVDQIELGHGPDYSDKLRYLSIKFLGSVVLAYLVVVQAVGVAMVLTYLGVVSGARTVLQDKGLNMVTFSFFTTVSTFTNCGFIPTNENMMIFKKNSVLLLILIPQVLLGNTLFPSCLRFFLWVFDKFSRKVETSYLLKKTKEVGYFHLLPGLHSKLQVATVFSFVGVQFAMFCAMQWNSDDLAGLSLYEKVCGILFQCVNSRHTGETIVDLSTIAPAILVLFVVMMYLPPYTSFLPVKDGEEGRLQVVSTDKPKIRGGILQNVIFSQLTYVAIFIIMICITERQKMKKDPLNFSLLNIVIEVISAYGNVGFTTGYSCDRQLKPEAGCTDKWFGFAGKWNDQGKVILMIVMVFGRLKKFNMNGGRGWKLIYITN